jgi:hypothetical protein
MDPGSAPYCGSWLNTARRKHTSVLGYTLPNREAKNMLETPQIPAQHRFTNTENKLCPKNEQRKLIKKSVRIHVKNFESTK